MMKRLLKILLIMSVMSAEYGSPSGGWLNGDKACAASIQLPSSGQTKCYDAYGDEIPCTGTGQDGAIQAGVAWNDSTRFTNNGNGTITDNLTGLIWLQNANCNETVGGISKASSYLNWSNALIWSNNLASGKCGLTDSSIAGYPGRGKTTGVEYHCHLQPA